MPMYEYACDDCGKHTEIIEKFSDTPLDHCPTCGGHIERVITTAAFVLKGGGWYKDGYSSKKEANGCEAKSEAKPDTTAPVCEKTGKPADAGCPCAPAKGASASGEGAAKIAP